MRPKLDDSQEPNRPHSPGEVAPETRVRNSKSAPPTSRVAFTESNALGSEVQTDATHTDSVPRRHRSLGRPHSRRGGREKKRHTEHKGLGGNTAASNLLAQHMPPGQWDVASGTSVSHDQPWYHVRAAQPGVVPDPLDSPADLAEWENADVAGWENAEWFGFGHEQVALAEASWDNGLEGWAASPWRKDLRTIEMPLNQDGCNMAITIWADRLEVEEAEKYIGLMCEQGWVPNRIAFAAVIHACTEKGDTERCQWWTNASPYAASDVAMPACNSKVSVLTVPCDVPASSNAYGAASGRSVTFL